MSARAAQEPDVKNLLEYGPNFGLPEDWAMAQQPPHEPDQPNPRPVAPPAQSDSKRKPEDKAELPRAPSAGEVDPNQMTPAPKPPNAGAQATNPERPASRPDPKTLTGPVLENQLQNTQREVDRLTAEVSKAAGKLAEATRARQAKEAERQGSIVGNMIKGAISGVATAELKRKMQPIETRPSRRARVRDDNRGAVKGAASAGVPEHVHMTGNLAELKEAEERALEEQNLVLEAQLDWLARRDELLNEREARRRVRPDQ